jgi:hypothetical protein
MKDRRKAGQRYYGAGDLDKGKQRTGETVEEMDRLVQKKIKELMEDMKTDRKVWKA